MHRGGFCQRLRSETLFSVKRISDLLIACSGTDYVAFWEITEQTGVLFGKNTHGEESAVAQIVSDMLEAKLVPVVATGGRFRILFPVGLDDRDCVREIIIRWKALRGRPGMGDVCLFARAGWSGDDSLQTRLM
jgi:hypothetical protein